MEAGLVQERLTVFLKQHVPQANLSAVDDVVLEYITEVLSGLGEEEDEDSSVDVDQIVEMISAYIPEFAAVNSSVVCEWLFSLVSLQKQHSDSVESSSKDCNHTLPRNEALTGSQFPAKVTSCQSCPDGEDVSRHLEFTKQESTSDASSEELCSVEDGRGKTTVSTQSTHSNADSPTDRETEPQEEQLSLLMEMFPEVDRGEVERVWRGCQRDTERSVQVLLEQAESAMLLQQETGKSDRQKKSRCVETQDPKEMKDFVLSRYEYVDTKEDQRFHRPCLPKQEEQKRIRY